MMMNAYSRISTATNRLLATEIVLAFALNLKRGALAHIYMIETMCSIELLEKGVLVSFFHRKSADMRETLEHFVETRKRWG